MPGSTRAPYLVTPTASSITIRWRSAAATPTVVSYGLSMSNLNLTFSADAGGVIDHSAQLTGLAAGTTYYYAAGAAAAPGGGSAGNYFKTAPATGAFAPTRMWFMGDFGAPQMRLLRCAAPRCNALRCCASCYAAPRYAAFSMRRAMLRHAVRVGQRCAALLRCTAMG